MLLLGDSGKEHDGLIFSHCGERASGGMMHKAVVFVLVNSSSGARGM